jgi:hypothetical protein
VLLTGLALELQHTLSRLEAEVAHLKMTLHPSPDTGGQIAAVHLVGNDMMPELNGPLQGLVEQGRLTVNLRAEAAPEALDQALTHALASVANKIRGLGLVIQQSDCFRPGRPVPTYRETLLTL